MKKAVTILLMGALFAGCALSDKQVKEAVQRNPDIIFTVIEENPEQFLEVVNRAAQKAQRAQYQKQLAEQEEEQLKDFRNPKKPELSADRRLSGSDKGNIVIVEYADFQCPACRMAYSSLKEFKTKYKDQVQFYYKHMPLDFHKMAYPSALYFEAIRLQDKDKALKFYDELFQNQKDLSDKFLKKAAVKVGADMKKLNKDLHSDAVKKIVEADMEEFQKFGFNGTPSIIMNGVAITGAQSLEALEAMAKKVTAQ